MTERYGQGESFKYMIPISKEGKYTLILKFSEIYFQRPGEKIFDVKIGNKFVAKKLDILAHVLQKNIPYDHFVEIEYKNKKIYLEGEEVQGALKKGKLQIDFNVGAQDNPKVNAIVLARGGLENTHHGAF